LAKNDPSIAQIWIANRRRKRVKSAVKIALLFVQFTISQGTTYNRKLE